MIRLVLLFVIASLALPPTCTGAAVSTRYNFSLNTSQNHSNFRANCTKFFSTSTLRKKPKYKFIDHFNMVSGVLLGKGKGTGQFFQKFRINVTDTKKVSSLSTIFTENKISLHTTTPLKRSETGRFTLTCTNPSKTALGIRGLFQLTVRLKGDPSEKLLQANVTRCNQQQEKSFQFYSDDDDWHVFLENYWSPNRWTIIKESAGWPNHFSTKLLYLRGEFCF